MPSHFKTPEGKAVYLEAYKAVMQSWPVPYDEVEVSGPFGNTFVVACGPQEAPPLVLLHGFFTTLLLWLPNIADLSKEYRVYSIDIMGNRNRSIPDDLIGNVDDMVEWLNGTLTGLGLDSVYLLGMSFGGWLGINLALTAPERVRKLALISPAASLLPLVKQFTLRAILSMLPPKRFWFRSFMGWMGLKSGPGHEFSQSLLDMMWLGGEHIEISAETMRVVPTVFTDEELERLRLPILLLIGENEVIYNPKAALDRARRLIPDLIGELVPRCGHDISFSQHEIVNRKVLAFLNSSSRNDTAL